MVRFKNRYFLLELIPFHLDEAEIANSRYHHKTESISDVVYNLPSFTSASVSTYIRNSVSINYGQFASSSLLQSLSVKYSNNSTNMVILRVPRDFHSEIWTSISFLTDWPAENPSLASNIKCTWRAVHCAGTIRSCQKAAISFAKKCLIKDGGDDNSLEPLAKKIKSIEP